MAHRLSIAGVAVVGAMLAAAPARAQQADWHTLEVPGGAATLASLGVPADRERALVMIDVIRRLHFPTNPAPLLTSLRELSVRPPDASSPTIALPSPLPPHMWSGVLARTFVPQRLFIDILNDEPGRLLYHGPAGLDRGTRLWFHSQPELLRWLYQEPDAVRSFSMFAPALRIVEGRIDVPGGPDAVRQWSTIVGSDVTHPENFVRRLFSHQAGRTAGLYFLSGAVNDSRRAFLLGTALPAARRERRFERLVSGFASCYPPRSTAYPFVLRSHDAALLLAEVDLTGAGALAGPSDRRFWEDVFGDVLRGGADSDEPGIDAAWMVNALCGAPAEHRALVFATLLAGHRTFGDVARAEWPDAVAALRVRRTHPALFVALEHAGLRRAGTYAAAARHAALLSQGLDAERSITGLRQFQGALMLTLNAAHAGTLTASQAESLIASLTKVPFHNQRYDGRLADWLARDWLPAATPAAAVAQQEPASPKLTSEGGPKPAGEGGPKLLSEGGSAERATAGALAGPVAVARRAVHWEGRDYVVDLSGATLQRLLEIRKRQNGVSVDRLMALHAIVSAVNEPRLGARASALASELAALAPHLALPAVADEYENDGVDVPAVLAGAVAELKAGRTAGVGATLAPVVDFILAHVLPSWAYAPHLGSAGSGALVGGDGSLRHRLGVRQLGRARLEQPWQLAISPAARGSIGGSILGVQAALASWSLRRLSSDAVPAAPAIDSNDAIPLMLTAAMINPRRLDDAGLAHLAAVQVNGSEAIMQARNDPARLDALAATAALSPWSRAVLPWMVREEPARVDEQFSPAERARIGGLRHDGLADWGSVWMPSGSLRPRLPTALFHELYAGRAADGIVGGRSMDVLLRVASYLSELKLPASLAAPVLSFAMRDHLDRVRPLHTADAGAFARQARTLTRSQVEDYVGALAATGPLRPVPRP